MHISSYHHQPPTTDHRANLWSWCPGRDARALAGPLCWGLLTASARAGPPASAPAGTLRSHPGPPRHRRRGPLRSRSPDLHSAGSCAPSDSHGSRKPEVRWTSVSTRCCWYVSVGSCSSGWSHLGSFLALDFISVTYVLKKQKQFCTKLITSEMRKIIFYCRLPCVIWR